MLFSNDYFLLKSYEIQNKVPKILTLDFNPESKIVKNNI